MVLNFRINNRRCLLTSYIDASADVDLMQRKKEKEKKKKERSKEREKERLKVTMLIKEYSEESEKFFNQTYLRGKDPFCFFGVLGGKK